MFSSIEQAGDFKLRHYRRRTAGSWQLQIAFGLAIATLWYVPIGSAIALLVLVLVGAEILG